MHHWGQTALFLACREGATECTIHLLDVLVNATVPDNLDRSPMTIATEQQQIKSLSAKKTSN
jgi:ankyrin repeat protein